MMPTPDNQLQIPIASDAEALATLAGILEQDLTAKSRAVMDVG